MRQPIWSSFEVALLIDAYWRIENGQITKKQAVYDISSMFRQYAVNQGIDIDDTYRNENGISMRFEELRYLFTGGKTGIKNTSKLFRIMINYYQHNQEKYQRILGTAKTMFDDSFQRNNGTDNHADTSIDNHAEESQTVKDCSDDILNSIRALLDKRFSYGFKIDSMRDLIRFRKFAEEEDIGSIPEKDDELRLLILSAGTFINDKLFAENKDLSVELQKIVQDIFNDGNAVVYYEALLEHHSEWMNKQHILSEEMLKELLQKQFPECYHAKRFMINGKKQTEKECVSSELKRIWGDSVTRTVDSLGENLPYIPTENIWRAISGSLNFTRVSEGLYFLNDKLIMTEEECSAIIEYVDKAYEEEGFASLGDLPIDSVEETNYEIPLSTIQSAIYGRLLSSKYNLNGRILTKENSELNSIVLLKQYLAKKESCTFDELSEKNIELTGVPNRKNVFQALYESMVRIDVDQFVAPGYVEFPIEEIDRVLSGLITDHFCAIKEITSFALFPMCGQSWNHYLLESYCYLYSKRYSLCLINFNDKNAGIISEKDFGKSYIEMLAIAAAKTDLELTPETIGAYLFQNGYAAKSKFGQLDEVAAMAKTLRKDL
ncbi:hypothetical protein [Ruminococcus flavefaciens]|uniref:Uncharacterized protein n=1 Tax=Ruminococcus flavefaciens TaxID=1265 RepID=A0A1M7IGT5_RUMFL|nr:hypothetical protein [Ruminococcus flavefaciens]SEH73958.1 hypothetical protein SAMN02910265_02403 [Ruminococcus flavefaciens]SHM39920.1 hypothetical protein SAMN04487860_104108 [Ruminococcus flavefaciens]